MPLVLFDANFSEHNPRVLPADARAVPAEPYVHIDDEAGNPGGVTRADLADDTIRPLGSFEDGAEVFIEGVADDDVLDDTDAETAAATRIWFRAAVLER